MQLHISMPNICVELHSGHEHNLWVSLPSWQPRASLHGGVNALEIGLLETCGRKAGGSALSCLCLWDLAAGEKGLQHLLEAGPTTNLAVQLKRGGIILDFLFIQHFTQLFRQPDSNESFHG